MNLEIDLLQSFSSQVSPQEFTDDELERLLRLKTLTGTERDDLERCFVTSPERLRQIRQNHISEVGMTRKERGRFERALIKPKP